MPLQPTFRILAGAVALLGVATAAPAPAVASDRSELLYSRGIVALHENRPEEALALFEQAVADDDADGHAWYYLALAKARLDRNAEAVAGFRRAAELLPDEPAVAYDLGLALSDAGAYAEATGHLRRAAGDTGFRARASMVLGLAELRLGNLAAADEAFVQAGSDPSLAARASFYRGVTAFRRGAFDEAEAHFEAVIATTADSGIATESRAYLERLRTGAAARDYALHAEAGLQYDSNVCLSPDGGCEFIAEEGTVDEADGRVVLSAGGRYLLWRSADVALSTGYDFFQSLHFDLGEFDLQNHRPDLQLAWRRGRVRAGVVARYDFFLRDGDSFLHEVNAVPWAAFDLDSFGRTEVHYRMRDREFVEDTFEPRSGFNHAFAARQVLPIAAAPGSHVALGLRYDLEDPSSGSADAQRFAYNGFEVSGEGRWLGPYDMAVVLGYAFRYENYDDVSADFVADFEAREDFEHLIRAEWEMPVWRFVALRTGYYGTFNDSSQPEEFDYQRHVVAASVALRY